MQQLYDTSSPAGKLQAIDGYRQAVQDRPGLSFKSFCDQSGIINYKPLLWWCNEHDISVMAIQRGRESKCSDKTPTFIQIRPRSNTVSIPMLRNVSITFPDGVNLTLQESGVSEVIALLGAYQSRHQAEGGARECSL